MHIRLWHAPYNGGWIGYDRKQWRRWACGWKPGPQNSWKGGPDPVLWWCFGGFWGRILLQSWPWQKNPGARSNAGLSHRSSEESNTKAEQKP